MDEKGTLTTFLICKIGVAIVAFALVGMAFSTYSSSRLFAERRELEEVAARIASAIETIDEILGEAELRRELRASTTQFEVSLKGELKDDIQLVRIKVVSKSQAERLIAMQTSVNGGDFELFVKNPSEIVAKKSDKIEVELF